MVRSIAGFRRSALCFLLLLSLAGCATLPALKNRFHRLKNASNQSPVIRDSLGLVPKRKSLAVLEGLKRELGSDHTVERTNRLMALIGGRPLTLGNRATLLVDRPRTYAAMREALDGAHDTVNIETFGFSNDRVGHAFSEQLLGLAHRGVRVNILYDSAGSFHSPRRFFERLRTGGLHMLEFNPVNPLRAWGGDWDLFERDHNKILVVDGAVGFTGSVNIGAVRSKVAEHERGRDASAVWHDTHLRIEGPAVSDLQSVFTRNWASQGGEILTERLYFPVQEEKGSDLVRIVDSNSGVENRRTYLTYLAAITFSGQFVHITDAYFAPDGQVVKALCSAAARGVDVRVIVPRLTDHKLVSYAGRYHYRELLDAGVRLYERRDVLLHSKTMVVDGLWSTVGSANLDMWSALRNREVTALVVSPRFAGELEALFRKDLAASDPFTLEAWKERSLMDRLHEGFAHLVSHWL